MLSYVRTIVMKLHIYVIVCIGINRCEFLCIIRFGRWIVLVNSCRNWHVMFDRQVLLR